MSRARLSSSGRAMRPGPNGAMRRHGGEPGDAGAAKQLQQQRLDLVVAMLGGDQHFAGSHAPAPAARSARRAPRLRVIRRACARMSRVQRRRTAAAVCAPRARNAGSTRRSPPADHDRRGSAAGRPSWRRCLASACASTVESTPPLKATTTRGRGPGQLDELRDDRVEHRGPSPLLGNAECPH